MLKILSKRMVSVLLIIVMSITLLPALGGGQAEAASSGLNLDAPFSRPAAGVDVSTIPSLTRGNPYETNQSSISISGSTVGLDPTTLSYRVKKLDSQQARDDGYAPSVTGDSFVFSNIMLFPGLNEIELYYQSGIDSSSTTKDTRYVYFLNAPSISGLEVFSTPKVPVQDFSPPPYTAAGFLNSASIFNRVMHIPTSAFAVSTPIIIEGNVANANEVFLEGQPAAVYGNRFVVDTSYAGIVKGDYKMNFSVRNESASVNYPYKLAFSNGEPMVLDIKANTTNPTNPDVPLDQMKTTHLSGNFNTGAEKFTFSGYLHIDSDARFSKMDVTLQQVTDSITDRASVTIDSQYLAAHSAPLLQVNNHTVQYAVYYLDKVVLQPNIMDPNDPTSFFDLTAAPGQYQLRFETYDEQSPAERHPNTQTYPINYVNENLPYIKSVTQNGVSLETVSLISRIGQEIVVETGGSTTGVKLKSTMLSTLYDPSPVATNPTETSPGSGIYVFKLDDLRPGIQTFEFIAEDDDNNTFRLEIPVEAVLTPTVKLKNLSVDQRFTTTTIPTITAEYVNLTATSERNKTQVFLNGELMTTTTASKVAGIGNATFTINIHGDDVRAGRNELRFKFTNNALTSEYTINFYYLASDSPFIEVVPMDGRDNEDKFVPTNNTGAFTTTESEVYFKGTIANANNFVIKQNGVVLASLVRSGNSWPNQNGVRINPVAGTSTYSFEVDAINLILENSDGTLNYNAENTFSFEVFKHDIDTFPLSVSTVTIMRHPAAYTPDALTQDFLDKGVINRNYFPFTIDTDGAIAVTVNKLPMKQVPQPVPTSKRIRYHLDIPLKTGNNKLNIEVVYPGTVVKDTLDILSTAINQPGAAQKDSLGKKVDFKMFNNDLQLKFPKGTLIRQAEPMPSNAGPISQLYNEVPLFFGIAVPSTGLVIEENRNQSVVQLMKQAIRLPSQYALAGEVYWIDAGLIENSNSANPLQAGAVEGGKAPFSLSGSTYVTFRYQFPYKKLEPSHTGSLTLKYDQNIVIAARQLLTVMYHDGRQWHNLGGMVDSKKGTITVPFNEFGYYTVMRLDESFVDVNQHDWARDDINILKARGWMRELSTNLFGVGTFATRGELATILVKALDIPLNYQGNNTFPDVGPNAMDNHGRWDYAHIETAARVGIIIGGAFNIFDADGSITRQDAAVMIARAMNLKLSSNESARPKMEKKFLDGAIINPYAFASIEAVEKKKIMQGLPGSAPKTLLFAPQANLTRAQLATMAVRVLRDLKRLEK